MIKQERKHKKRKYDKACEPPELADALRLLSFCNARVVDKEE